MDSDMVWSREFLDGGNFKTQHEWKEWCKDNDWSLPLVQDFVSLLDLQENDTVRRTVFNLLSYSLQPVMTANNWGPRSIAVNFVGKSGLIAVGDFGSCPALGVKPR